MAWCGMGRREGKELEKDGNIIEGNIVV